LFNQNFYLFYNNFFTPKIWLFLQQFLQHTLNFRKQVFEKKIIGVKNFGVRKFGVKKFGVKTLV